LEISQHKKWLYHVVRMEHIRYSNLNVDLSEEEEEEEEEDLDDR